MSDCVRVSIEWTDGWGGRVVRWGHAIYVYAGECGWVTVLYIILCLRLLSLRPFFPCLSFFFFSFCFEG